MSDLPEDVRLVQRFLETEVSPDFELVDLLSRGVAIHHRGLSDEALRLVEWLTSNNRIKVLCATSTIAQGMNFPVSSVFLASRQLAGLPAREMSHRAFWNLMGRAGRLGQDSVGVVGIAAGKDPAATRLFVEASLGELRSRLVELARRLVQLGEEQQLAKVLNDDEWLDFRRYLAHLVVDSSARGQNTEQFLRNTLGYYSLRSSKVPEDRAAAEALLNVSREYSEQLAENLGIARLADTTGFDPQCVRRVLVDVGKVAAQHGSELWTAGSLFGGGEGPRKTLAELVGVMLTIPQLGLQEIGGSGMTHEQIARVAQAWVGGASMGEIAKDAFLGPDGDLTTAITEACQAVFGKLMTGGAWGLGALSSLPSSGLDHDDPEVVKTASMLPAMLYHGVSTEHGVLMRMADVPRSVAETLGREFTASGGGRSVVAAREWLSRLDADEWARAAPPGATLNGEQYRRLWQQLAGERVAAA